MMDWDRLGRDARWITVGLALGAALVLLMGCSTTAGAQQPEWVQISRTSDRIWEGRIGSFSLGRNDANQPMAWLMIRVRDLSGDKTITFERDYVTLRDCAVGYGKLVTLDLYGRYRYDNDFVFDGGSVAARIAATICGMAQPTGQSF
jgi:hypothetical protein